MSGRIDIKSRGLILLIMIAASGASILSTDLYAPTLPHLPAYFGTDATTVQLTMALNMGAYAISQLLWGPLGIGTDAVRSSSTGWPHSC